MFVQVNGARLYFDVDGAGSVPDGAGLREKPTLVLLHGGPGFDHALFKPCLLGTRRHRAGDLRRGTSCDSSGSAVAATSVPRRPGTGVTVMREFILE